MAALASPCLAAKLHIEVDDERGVPVWTRLEVRNPAGEMFQPANSIHETTTKARGGQPFYLRSFIVNGTADLDVPPGAYTVIAEHGLEYQRVEREIRVESEKPAALKLQLRPWIRMLEQGWWSGDFHVHRPLADAPGIAQAEDLNFTVLVNRDKREFFNHWPAQGVTRIADGYFLSLRNAEDERRGGAWILDALETPLAVSGESGWYPPGLRYVEASRAERKTGAALPWFDLDMPFWWETPVMVALATPDSIDILHNQFMQYGIDDSEYWGRPRDRAEFPGKQGFVDYCMDLYYRYLNLGFRIPPSAGTGTGVMPSPAGYDRVYAHIDGPFNISKWYETIRDGQSFVTNGPMLFLDVTRKWGSVVIDARAVAREPIDRIELVANGRVIQTVRAGRAQFAVDARQYSWCAVRCFLETPDNIRLAHSSPIYLDGRYDAREDASYFVSWIDALIEQTNEDPGRFRNEAERDEALANYRRAREFYQSKVYGAPTPALAQRPPMGWNSYNAFGNKIDDALIRAQVDALVASGMKDAGYEYVNLDEGWAGTRDGEGFIHPNSRFPDMKALADYIHSKGLKFGIYSSPAPRTCVGNMGSMGHEKEDAETYARWGVDYLKYDVCDLEDTYNRTLAQDPAAAHTAMLGWYRKMYDALRATGRPIVYSLCQYGLDAVWQWGPEVGGNLWRTTSDVKDNYGAITANGFSEAGLARYASPGHWNDPDMLEVANGKSSVEDGRTQMSLWAILAAPLLAGNDLTKMTDETREILSNREVIAVDQDAAGKQGDRVAIEGPLEVWMRPLADGSKAVGLFNRGRSGMKMSLRFADIGFAGAVTARDLWTHRDLGVLRDRYETFVPKHGVAMLRIAASPAAK